MAMPTDTLPFESALAEQAMQRALENLLNYKKPPSKEDRAAIPLGEAMEIIESLEKALGEGNELGIERVYRSLHKDIEIKCKASGKPNWLTELRSKSIPPRPETEGEKQEEQEEETFKFLEFKDLRSLPKPEWLLYNVLPTKGVSFIYGPPKSGKTFVMVTIAGSVASENINWMDFATKHGHVIYIAAEDIDEVARRFIAWAEVNKISDLPNLHFFPCPLALAKDTPRFMDAIDRRYPDAKIVLFVVDTLAMCSLGVDENTKKDFDAVLGSLETLWRKYNCSVVAVHHSGKNGEMRGTSSMDGIAYSKIEVSAVENRVALKCKEKRRGRAFDDIWFDEQIVQMDTLDEMGFPEVARVLVKSDGTTSSNKAEKLTKLQTAVLQHIYNFGGTKVPRTEVMKACEIDRSHESSFVNAVSILLQKEYLEPPYVEKQRTYYTLTSSAIELLQNVEL